MSITTPTTETISFTPEVAARHQQHWQRLQRLSQLDDLAHHYPDIDRAITLFLADMIRQLNEQR